MGKITVKHYLNTRVAPLSPELFDGYELYPIYVQVTYNRKTTQIRSFSEALSTIKGIEYLKNNIVDDKEIFYTGDANLLDALRNEIRVIELGISYILQHNIDISKTGHDLRDVLDKLLTPVSNILIDSFYIWIVAGHVSDSNYNTALYGAFNHNRTISENISTIKKSTKLDLSDYIYPDDLALSQDIDIYIKKTGKNLLYIDLVQSDYLLNARKMKSLKNAPAFARYLQFVTETQVADFVASI